MKGANAVPRSITSNPRGSPTFSQAKLRRQQSLQYINSRRGALVHTLRVLDRSVKRFRGYPSGQMSLQGHLQPSAGVAPMSALTSKAVIGLRRMPPPDVMFFPARYVKSVS
jgi:hypothetical protein